MQLKRDHLTDAQEALVELELCGFEFTVQGGDIHYQARPGSLPDRRLVEHRLGLIKRHKDLIRDWLGSRTPQEIDDCADRITARVTRLVHEFRLQQDDRQRQAQYWLDHLARLEANFERVRSQASHQSS